MAKKKLNEKKTNTRDAAVQNIPCTVYQNVHKNYAEKYEENIAKKWYF